jgi:hypothetical protein
MRFVYPTFEHREQAHAEKPMLDQLQNAIERQQRLCGDQAFVRHDPERLPTQRARVDEPNFYVMSDAEWKALSRLDRVKLYQTGRNLFISGMLVGDLDGGVEESISLLHRLDEKMEVQGNSLSSLVDGLNAYSDSDWVTQAAEVETPKKVD